MEPSPVLCIGDFLFFAANAIATEPIELTDSAILHFNENTGRVAYYSTDNHNDFSWGYNFWAGG